VKVVVSVAPTQIEQLARWAQACDSLGIDGLGLGDSPGYHETWVSVSVAASTTQRLRIGPLVTNFKTRSPSVTAAALRSVDELSGGRAFAGVGAGDSAVVGAGLAPATATDIRSGIEVLRSLWADRPEARGAGWQILLAANGPAALRAGGALADVVLVGTGISPDAVQRARADVVSGYHAAASERPAPELWTVVRMSIDDDPDRALMPLRPLLASGANHVFRSAAERETIPEPIAAKVTELRSRYDYSSHGRREGNPNAELVDELGLREFLGRRFALAGPPRQVAEGLSQLEGLGVSGVTIPAVGLDTELLIRRLGEEVLPRLAALRHEATWES
jgi:5,10-methylenetetrahydromethanopterin reductase